MSSTPSTGNLLGNAIREYRRTATAADFSGIPRTAQPNPLRGLSWDAAAVDEPISYSLATMPANLWHIRRIITHEQWTAISAGLKMLGEAHVAAVTCDTEKLTKLKQESDRLYEASKIAKFSKPKKEGWAGPGEPHTVNDDGMEIRARSYANTITTNPAQGWFVTSAI